MKKKIEDIEQQHLENYRKAVYDTIEDNTDKLIQEDSVPLFKEPPLASMDVLKSKILEKAKEEKIVLSTVQLNKVISDFRNNMIAELPEVGAFRKERLHSCMYTITEEENFEDEKLLSLFEEVREKIKNLFEKKLEYYLQEEMIPSLSTFFQSTKNNLPESTDNFLSSIGEYLTFRYPELITDVFIGKIILKDQILVNRLKEHNERFNFTKAHSHLLNSSSEANIIHKEKRS